MPSNGFRVSSRVVAVAHPRVHRELQHVVSVLQQKIPERRRMPPFSLCLHRQVKKDNHPHSTGLQAFPSVWVSMLHPRPHLLPRTNPLRAGTAPSVIRQIKLVQLAVMVQPQARLKTIHRQTAVGHNSPPLGREGLPFFFFNRNVITKNIDLVFLDFSYGSKRHTFKNIRPIMRFHFDCSI